MYELRSGKRNISLPHDTIESKHEAIGAAMTIVQGNCLPERLRRSGARPPRAVTVVGVRGAAKNAKPVTVVALGARRDSVMLMAA